MVFYFSILECEVCVRLDKYISDALDATRKEATKIIKSGDVTVNGKVANKGVIQITPECKIEWQEREISQLKQRYIMLHKPKGFVCSHEDDFNSRALDLLNEVKVERLHFAGRLDVDTTGLVLITDDGKWSHRITSPKHQCEKRYKVTLADPIQPEYVDQCLKGIELRGERNLTLPAKFEILSTNEGIISIHEGRYHQVKRMFAALGNRVEELHRERVGTIILDKDLELGEYRDLSQKEIDSVW